MSDLRMIIRELDGKVGLFAGDAVHLGAVDFVSELDESSIIKFIDETPFDNEEFTVPGRASSRNGETTKTVTHNRSRLYAFEMTPLGSTQNPIRLRLGVIQDPPEDRISYYFLRSIGNSITAIYRVHFDQCDTAISMDIQNGTAHTQVVSITRGDSTADQEIKAGEISPTEEVPLDFPGVALTVQLETSLIPAPGSEPIPADELLQGGGTAQIEIIVDPIVD